MKLLTNNQAAEMMGLAPNTLEQYRSQGKGPRFLKLNPEGSRSAIRYRESDVLRYL